MNETKYSLTMQQYESLKSLIAELDDIEDMAAGGDTDAYWLAGNIRRDNLNDIREFLGLAPSLPVTLSSMLIQPPSDKEIK